MLSTETILEYNFTATDLWHLKMKLNLDVSWNVGYVVIR